MKRVAGIMRVRNEGNFIHDCVESCIDALDELIVVYNDCTDNSGNKESGGQISRQDTLLRIPL